jgi:hypothetical protein
MNNSDMPAAPVITSTTVDTAQSTLTSVGTTGLTKREHFAGVIIQGLLAGGVYSEVGHCIEECIEYTDALLKALEDDL